jgi:hypothetical protein
MTTKLTLRMDENLINQAKDYAKHSGKSVSKLVADFFALLNPEPEEDFDEISPKVNLFWELCRILELVLRITKNILRKNIHDCTIRYRCRSRFIFG